ncbi:MAG: hypothetical protein ABI574_13105 [Burkholderiales bacterium]
MALWLNFEGTLAAAAPFVPVNDAEVVATLPSRVGPQAQADRQRRAQLQRQPTDLPLALQTARAAIERARQSGDPRELGEAQAALAPWWTAADAPPPARLLRAIVRQSQHDFDGALRDLDTLAAGPAPTPLPLRAQALLSRGAVLQLQGRFASALQDCQALQQPPLSQLGAAVVFAGQVCSAELAGLQGRARAAQSLLARLAEQAPPDEAGWLTLVRAELADRLGDATAGTRFREAAEQRGDIYSLAALADWLLAARRPQEVITLLKGREDADALLLRLAIAYRAAGDARSADAVRMLQERFDALRQRGDTTHAREEARFWLVLKNDPARALTLAQTNWHHQKEPADARLLMRAAQAAGQPAAAEPVRRFMRETGYTDVRLAEASP